jgi:hypothetical protein
MIRLGIIGLSEGNGHPYSWSAIFNGYSRTKMEQCGFPVIPRYLEKQTWPNARIKNAVVSCVWTQDKSISKKIADTVYIDRVCDSLEEMARTVDGVLLARDDSENHFIHSLPFLKKGIPIYIDKPLSTRTINAKEILSKQRWNGQIFSCSALRYDEDLDIKHWLESKSVARIIARTPNSWEKYAIHCIDPIVSSCLGKFDIISSKRCQVDNIVSTSIEIKYKGKKMTIDLTALGDKKIPINFILLDGNDQTICQLIHQNAFKSFKSALEIFISKTCIERGCAIDVDQMLKSVKLIERGLK